jgi:hypothetical protein
MSMGLKADFISEIEIITCSFTKPSGACLHLQSKMGSRWLGLLKRNANDHPISRQLAI